jgi:TIR domain
VPAISPTVCPCYASSDGEMAAAIAGFLERGADVRVFLEEGEMRPGQDLAQKAREARVADIVLVLFSRNSMQPRWPRTQWEDALISEPAEEGVRIGFVRCDDCVPPRVLAPQFDLKGRSLDGLRKLKRWVRQRAASYTPPAPEGVVDPGDLEVLGIAIADRPGTETVAGAALAFEFVAAYYEDYDEVFELECGDRSLTALAGDLAAQLGLRLEDDIETNLARLREFCSARRFLVLLTGATNPAAHEMVFGGRCSTLMVTASARADRPPSRDSLRQIQHVFAHLDEQADWAAVCRLARQGRSLTRDLGRNAECYELMRQWHRAAEARGDRAALNESSRELVWILEAWGRTEEARTLDYRRATEFDEQMMLPF